MSKTMNHFMGDVPIKLKKMKAKTEKSDKEKYGIRNCNICIKMEPIKKRK